MDLYEKPCLPDKIHSSFSWIILTIKTLFLKKDTKWNKENAIGITTFLPSFRGNQINYSRVLNYYNNVPCATTFGIKFVESGKEAYILQK